GYSEYSSTTVLDGSKESPRQGDRTISVVTQPPCLGLSIEPINPVVLEHAVKSPQEQLEWLPLFERLLVYHNGSAFMNTVQPMA
ncbi:hypothetical protein Tco_0757385, partial [Tanacetum coccineum]